MSSQDSTTPARREITVRRAPKYVPFMVAGGLLGIIVAAIAAYGFHSEDSVVPGEVYEASTVFGFFAVIFAAAGVVVGCLVALLMDRLSLKNQRTAVVQELTPSEEAQAAAAEAADDEA
ncbi:hypothetical protein ACQR35_00720 [Pseudarthrobacter sp. J1738]|uniref:hypothetical protein n=1 Tax=unclassified Pseudarthrobacter TaxID=2647000 RepID=UPI003D2E1EB0